jgi:hypothetical protein
VTRRARAGIAFLALWAAAAPAAAATHVTGVVRTSLRPLAGVHVVAPAAAVFATTDSTGRFMLGPLMPGPHELSLVAVGYASEATTIVLPDSGADVFDAGPWVLSPLRPDETPPGFGLDSTIARARLADSLAALPPPPPIVAPVGLYVTLEESGRTHAPPLDDLLRRITTADSITTATQGTGAPGWETWRQWGDRLAVAASDSARAANPSLARDSSLALRTLAYARTRAALAAGPTSIGYGLAASAHKALEHARRAAGGEGEAFLAHLGDEIDRVFVPGSTPPPAPKAAPKKKKSRAKRGR